MSNKIKNFISWVDATFTSIIGVLSYFIINKLNILFKGQILSILATIIIVILFSKSIHYLITKLISESSKMRKLIMKNEYIEGVWMDIVMDKTDITSYAIFSIVYENNQFINSGRIYNIEGDKIGSFTSHSTFYNSYKLNFMYEGYAQNVKDKKSAGFGEYTFERNKKEPNELEGFIYDTHYRKNLIVRAIRVNENDAKNMNDKDFRQKYFNRMKINYC